MAIKPGDRGHVAEHNTIDTRLDALEALPPGTSDSAVAGFVATGPETTAALDAATAALVPDSGTATGAALSAAYVSVFTPEFYGAKGDGTTDDSAAIQSALDAAGAVGGVVQLGQGVIYAVASMLTLPASTDIRVVGSRSGKILATAAMDALMRKPNTGAISGGVLDNVTLDGAGLATTVLDIQKCHAFKILGGNIRNGAPGGDTVLFGGLGDQCYEIYVGQGLRIDGLLSATAPASQQPAYGLRTGSLSVTDSRFENFEVVNARTTVKEAGQANWWTNVHAYQYPYRTTSSALDYSEGSVGFDVTGQHNVFVACYADTQATGFKLEGFLNWVLAGSRVLWPGNHTPNYNPIGIDLIGPSNTVTGVEFIIPAGVTLAAGIREGATAYKSRIDGNRFSGGALATFIVSSGTPDWYGTSNGGDLGYVAERRKSQFGSTLDLALGNTNDVLMKWGGAQAGQILVLAAFIRMVGNFQIGATGANVGFLGATPVAQQAVSTDVQTILERFGLMAAGTQRSWRTGVQGRSANVTLTTDAGELQIVDATAGAITVTLPTGEKVGSSFIVKKTDVSGNAVTIAGTSIDGSPTYALSARYQFVHVISSGSGNWQVVGKN